MNGELVEITGLAEAGAIAAALERLDGMLADAPPGGLRLQAQALELAGRCQQGLIANVPAQEAFAEAARLYAQAGDAESAAYCGLLKVRQLLDERLLPEAREHIAAALSLAGRQGWPDLRALACEFQGLASMHVREHASAVRLLREALAEPDRRKLSWEPLIIRMALGSCSIALGEAERGRVELALVEADSRTRLIPRVGAYMLMNQGYGAWLAGDLASANKSFAAVLELAEQQEHASSGMRWLMNMAAYNLGLSDLQLGDHAQAHEKLLNAWRIAREHGHYQLASACLSSLCITSLMLDAPEEGLRYAKLGNELAKRHEDFETHILPYYSAVVYLANGKLEQARRLWLNKPMLEYNVEAQVQYNFVLRLLNHLDGNPVYKLSQPAQNLAWRWRGEVHGLLAEESASRVQL
jgi:tetratricopeptide (TPR) repeat protein